MLLDAAAVAEAVGRVGEGLSRDLGDVRPVLVGVLDGAAMFLADLVRRFDFACEVDFLSISPFGRGRVRIESDLSADISGRHVVIVEDIVDTGLTLTYLLGALEVRRPASLQVAALLDRRAQRLVDVPVRWAGQEVGSDFVVGYGMDFEGRYRNLREVRVVRDLNALAGDPDLLVPEVYPAPGAGLEGPSTR